MLLQIQQAVVRSLRNSPDHVLVGVSKLSFVPLFILLMPASTTKETLHALRLARKPDEAEIPLRERLCLIGAKLVNAKQPLLKGEVVVIAQTGPFFGQQGVIEAAEGPFFGRCVVSVGAERLSLLRSEIAVWATWEEVPPPPPHVAPTVVAPDKHEEGIGPNTKRSYVKSALRRAMKGKTSGVSGLKVQGVEPGVSVI